MSEYRSRKVKLWCELDGVEMEIVRFGADYRLNSIPSGSVQLALGRRADTLAPHPIHSMIKRLRNKKPIKVWGQFTSGGSFNFGPLNAEDPPDGETALLFDGYTTGPGYERGTSAASYTIGIEGWLADLAYSSAISKSLHPSSPSDLVFPAVMRAPTPETAAGAQALGGMTGAVTAALFSNPQFYDDLWSNGLKLWFQALANQDHLAALGSPLAVTGSLGPNGPNTQALKALSRMNLGDMGSPALKLDLGGASASRLHIARNIQKELSRQTLETAAAQTMWDALIGMAGSFMFAVSPGIEKAAVVPLNPVLRKHYKTIYANEYDGGSLSGDMPRVLRAVGLFGSMRTEGNSTPGGSDQPDFRQIGIGGWYEPAGAADGLVLLRTIPGWLNGPAAELFLQPWIGRNALLFPTAAAPNAPAGGPPPSTWSSVLAGMNDVINQFARSVYAGEVLKYRSGTLSGKFRTDIAPGSIIRLETAAEKFVGPADELGQFLFATVTQVSLFADAEASRAVTTLGLAHHRAEDENTADATSMDRHPLYATSWSGGSLRK